MSRRVFRTRRALRTLAAACVVAILAAPAQAAAILACRLSIDDGVKADPPATLIVRVSPQDYETFKDGAWGRNYCGPHGGEAPDVRCAIHEGAFLADWAWESNVGRLERHIVLDLSTGQFLDRDHNGLEQKGVCVPAPDPALAKTATP